MIINKGSENMYDIYEWLLVFEMNIHIYVQMTNWIFKYQFSIELYEK